jgi:hypothetical protein
MLWKGASAAGLALVTLAVVVAAMAGESDAGPRPGTLERVAASQQHQRSGAGAVAEPRTSRVTLEELEAAIQAYLECGAAAGFTPRSVPGDGLRPTAPYFSIPDDDGVPDSDTVARANAIISECLATHLLEVETAWREQFTGDEAVAAAHTLLTECMNAAGAPNMPGFVSVEHVNEQLLNRDKTPEEREWMRIYNACADVVQAKQGYKLPKGAG